ncbi:chemokine-like protein TAFA-5a isoform X4 [Phycodurus eques]|uniref:chemokine-like protein TAFA-5a isoform X4 n=1 Tax=Phycodurus eques TaxID=693459 RepID=UPI002ACDB7DB|nr:chemokine-like protein TAFA-5a isoform X4 [Phycodurus eques]
MASLTRSARRKDASRWPRMSSTFWAFVLLTALLVLYCGQLAAGTCEIVTLDRDSSQPRRTIARQTARCACKKGQIAGTTRARPACVDAAIVRKKQWCEMVPCLEDEGCDLLVNKSGWTCTQPGGRVKTTTAACFEDIGAIRLTVAVSRALSPSSASQCLRGTSSSRSPRNPSTAEVLGGAKSAHLALHFGESGKTMSVLLVRGREGEARRMGKKSRDSSRSSDRKRLGSMY